MALPTDSPAGVQVHRGEVLHFLSDPGTDAAPGQLRAFPRRSADRPRRAHRRSRSSGSVAGEAAGRHAGHVAPRLYFDTRLHRHPHPLSAGGRHRRRRTRAARLVAGLHVSSRKGDLRDFAHASAVAEVFLDELMRNGTTTALVFCTVHSASVEAFFQAAQRRNVRMIAGKVLMDRNCPDYLAEPADVGARATRELIERWHGRERLSYAITPRFAPTSSDEQLASAGRLAREYPSTYIHSHLAENHSEIAWVGSFFRRLAPTSTSTTASVWCATAPCMRIVCTWTPPIALAWREAGAAAAFCPSSNLFLGSGLFDLAATDAARLRFALGTDVGGGTSFSMLRTMADAYKVAQLSGQRLPALRAFYLATLGAARCLGPRRTHRAIQSGCGSRLHCTGSARHAAHRASYGERAQPRRSAARADDAGR